MLYLDFLTHPGLLALLMMALLAISGQRMNPGLAFNDFMNAICFIAEEYRILPEAVRRPYKIMFGGVCKPNNDYSASTYGSQLFSVITLVNRKVLEILAKPLGVFNMHSRTDRHSVDWTTLFRLFGTHIRLLGARLCQSVWHPADFPVIKHRNWIDGPCYVVALHEGMFFLDKLLNSPYLEGHRVSLCMVVRRLSGFTVISMGFRLLQSKLVRPCVDKAYNLLAAVLKTIFLALMSVYMMIFTPVPFPRPYSEDRGVRGRPGKVFDIADIDEFHMSPVDHVPDSSSSDEELANCLKSTSDNTSGHSPLLNPENKGANQSTGASSSRSDGPRPTGRRTAPVNEPMVRRHPHRVGRHRPPEVFQPHFAPFPRSLEKLRTIQVSRRSTCYGKTSTDVW